MGTKMRPSYANRFSASWKNNFVTNLMALNWNFTAITSMIALV